MIRRFRSLPLAAAVLAVLSVTPAARADTAPVVVPMLDCVTYDPDSSALTAEFGYVNTGAATLTVLWSANNIFLQPPIFHVGQPTSFLPGVNHRVFDVTVNASRTPQLTWYLNGSTVTASNDPALYCGAPTLHDASLTMPATLGTTTGTDTSLTATVTDPKAPSTAPHGTVVYTLPAGLDAGTLPSGSACVVGTGQVACPIGAGSDDTVPVHSAIPGVYPVTGTFLSAQFLDPDATDNVATTIVRVTGTPAAVTGLAGTVSSTGAELTGSATPAGDAATGAFSYWPDGHPELAATVGSSDLGDGFDAVPLDAVLTGLTPGTAYDYVATATNGNGTATGAQRSFTTLAATVPSAGLSLTATAPATAAVGDAVGQTFTVADGGATDATGVHLTLHLADGWTAVSATPAAGSCSTSGTPATVVCDLGTVAAGSSVPVTVTSTAAAAGTLIASGFVAGDEPDPSAGDNAATTAVPVTRTPAVRADLSVAITGLRSAARPIAYTVTVRNAGPARADGVRLALAAGNGRVSWVSSSGHTCTAGSPAGCALGGIGKGGVVRVTVQVVPRSRGPVTLTATVHATTADPDPADNRGTLTVRAR